MSILKTILLAYVYLETSFLGIDTLTSAQTAIIEPIAQLCPYEYGNCVYQARALMASIDETYADINDDKACEEAKPLMRPHTRPEAYTILPNPARDRFTVALPTVNAPTHIRVISLFGSVLMTMPTSGGTSMDIDCSELPNGIYIVTASNQYRWFPVGKVNIYR